MKMPTQQKEFRPHMNSFKGFGTIPFAKLAYYDLPFVGKDLCYPADICRGYHLSCWFPKKIEKESRHPTMRFSIVIRISSV